MKRPIQAPYSVGLDLPHNILFRLWNRPSPSLTMSGTQAIRLAADIALLNLALVLACAARYVYTVIYGIDILSPREQIIWYFGEYVELAPVAMVIAAGVFFVSGFYSYGRAYQTRYKALIVAQAVLLVFLLIGVLAYLVPAVVSPPRGILLSAWAISTFLFVSSRVWTAVWRHVVRTEGDYSQGSKPIGRDRTVLVIGGAGYIGSALLPKLLATGYRVRVLDAFLYGTGPVEEFLEHPRLEFIRADFRHIDALVRAMRGVDHVVHLGGIVGDPACAIDEELTVDVNLTATRLIAEVAKGHGIKHFIFASTCSVYGAGSEVLDENSVLRPLSLYARSKVASERVLLDMGDDTFTPVIVRFGTIYGLSGRTRFDLVVNVLAAKAVFEGAITVFGGSQWRPFLHVDDAALAISQLLRRPAGSGAEIFNVGSNKENYTIEQVAEIVKKYVPEAEIHKLGNDQDRRDYRVSFSKIEALVGFKPKWTVEDGVRQVVEAIKAGQVADYTEMRYSNEKFLNEARAVGLAPPKTQWAHELIRQIDFGKA